jgi:lon-related putative ATP-dependent protease
MSIRDDLKVPVEKLTPIEKLSSYSQMIKKNKMPLLKETEFIGQKRAIESLKFGLGIEESGYNIFVTGIPNTGRTSMIYKYLKEYTKGIKKTKRKLVDICYVYNFSDPDQPKLLIIGKGKGKEFKSEIENLEKQLKNKILAIFKQPRPIERDESNPENDKPKSVSQKKRISDFELIIQLVNSIFEPLFRKYQTENDICEFLSQLKKWTFSNIDLFLSAQNLFGLSTNGNGNGLLPFVVNVLLDNSQTDYLPVIVEEYPSFSNLFGTIVKKYLHGGYIADHTMIKTSSLIKAKGGYLIVDAFDLLTNPGVWQKLKKTLETGYLTIEDIYHYLGYQTESLNPEPIPIDDVKVIVICDSWIYYLLKIYDRDFLEYFKVKVEFDHQIDFSPELVQNYCRFIDFVIKKEKLFDFDAQAKIKIIEYGIRLVNDQKKISTEFGKIRDLIIEANYWAKENGAEIVKAEHIKMALDKKRERAKLLEEKYQEFIKRDFVFIDTEGSRIGQVNGLAVLQADYPFGLPVKITAQTYKGSKGIVSIQRTVGLAGPIHNTGVEILSNYFNARFGQKESLSFSASICFEQNYGQIEGDSATAAELVAIISALTQLPVDQSLAITGSMNQKGEIQPIGGVNEKIEGFFDICLAKGLNGNQGVVVPYANLENLVLKEEVVEAVKNGKFHIYAVKTIDEVLEILLNTKADEIHKKVEEQLKQYNKKK